MKKPDLLSILLTFFLGAAGGVYLYLVGYAPTVATLEVSSREKVEALTIESDVYGGCRDTCPSFQVLGDGSYRYLYSIMYDKPPVIQSGSIPYAMRRDLQRNLTPQALATQSQTITPTVCRSFSDGIDVRYTITLKGEAYLLDTCGTQVDTDSPLWLSIRKIWDYLEKASTQ
jgi:hypothetical protein